MPAKAAALSVQATRNPPTFVSRFPLCRLRTHRRRRKRLRRESPATKGSTSRPVGSAVARTRRGQERLECRYGGLSSTRRRRGAQGPQHREAAPRPGGRDVRCCGDPPRDGRLRLQLFLALRGGPVRRREKPRRLECGPENRGGGLFAGPTARV